MRDNSNANLMWFLAGLGLGTAIGLVSAPRAGADTRRLLGEKANEAGSYLASNGRDYLDRGRDLYERGRQLADEAADMFDEGRRLMAQADGTES